MAPQFDYSNAEFAPLLANIMKWEGAFTKAFNTSDRSRMKVARNNVHHWMKALEKKI